MKDTIAANLLNFAAAMSRSLNAQAVLDNALESLLKWPGIDAVWIYLTTPGGKLHQAAGQAKGSVAAYALDLDEVAAGAFGAREPGAAPLPADHPSHLRAIATFPLMDCDEEMGVLVLGSLSYGGDAALAPGLGAMEVLSGMAGLLSAALVNARQYQQTLRVRDRLATMHTAVAHIQRATDLCSKMQMIANALHNMGWGHVTLWLCNGEMAMTDVVYAGITFQEEARLRQAPPPGLEVYRRPPEELEPFRIGSGYLIAAQPAPGLSGQPASWQPGAAVYIPLLSGDLDAHKRRIAGSIELRNPTDGLRPSQDQLSIVELFAREAVHEIERARQVDWQRLQMQDLAMLYEAGSAIFSHREQVAILALLNRTLCDMAETASACFAELDLERLVARRVSCHHTVNALPGERALLSLHSAYPLSSDLVDQVIHNRQPYVMRQGESSLLYLPMCLGEHILGLIEIYDGRPGRVFEERQIALCRAVVNQAAIALSHARLYQHTAIERSRLRAILEASHDGIVLISHEGIIMDLNGAACRLLRLAGEPEDWLDHSVLDVAWSVRGRVPAVARAALREARRIRQGDGTPGRGDFEVAGASPMFIRYTIYPIQTPDPEVTGWLLLLHDYTEEHSLNRMRGDLTHMLVHDLRSPLTAIIGAVNLLCGGMLGALPDDQYTMLDIIRRNGESMRDLITAILDIAHLETGEFPLDRQPISLAWLLTGVVGALTPLAEERQLHLSVDLSPDLPMAWADQRIIERVVGNLVNNAIKFTPPSGQVTLAVRAEDSVLILSVTDSGPGIEPHLRDQLFEKFATGQVEGHGSGLGLAFCKLAVEAHGGRIWVESPAPSLPAGQGPGSAFIFTLPVAAV